MRKSENGILEHAQESLCTVKFLWSSQSFLAQPAPKPMLYIVRAAQSMHHEPVTMLPASNPSNHSVAWHRRACQSWWLLMLQHANTSRSQKIYCNYILYIMYIYIYSTINISSKWRVIQISHLAKDLLGKSVQVVWYILQYVPLKVAAVVAPSCLCDVFGLSRYKYSAIGMR